MGNFAGYTPREGTAFEKAQVSCACMANGCEVPLWLMYVFLCGMGGTAARSLHLCMDGE